MARIDLHNFFQYYDEKNPNHVKSVQWLEDNLPVKYLEDTVDWAEIYRGKKGSAVTAVAAKESSTETIVCSKCGKGLAPVAAPVTPVTTGDDMTMTGIKLIKEFEGCHLKAYPDPLSGGLPITIGWGTTRKKNGSPFNMGDSITQQEADELLITQCKNQFLPSLRKIPHWNEMSDGKRGALLSFAYNLGAGFYGSGDFNTITKRLKNKEWDLVPDALYLYRNPGSNVEAGLARRRKAEGEAWKKG
jgi:GH24 family phage-related lysozyme (muramidase)